MEFNELRDGDLLRFDYVNYKGISGTRNVIFHGIQYTSNAYHKDDQWLMRCTDLDKLEIRYFAMRDMSNVVIGG